MKIEKSQVEKILISEVKGLCPVTVFFEDLGEQRGKVTIECDGDAWSYVWGAIGRGYTVKEFFSKCDYDYLSRKFHGTAIYEIDTEALKNHAKKEIIRMRKDNEATESEARELFEIAHDLENLWNDGHGYSNDFINAMQRVYGDDWYHYMPQKKTQKFERLCLIVRTIKECLKIRLPEVRG